MEYETPNLMTAMQGPLNLLEKNIVDKKYEIENWFNQQWKKTPAPVYGSIDLRNAGFKIAPVDMNLFPAGFNNLNPAFLPISIEAAKIAIKTAVPNANSILLITESHTRNIFYWENIKTLKHILEQAGFRVELGIIDAENEESNIPSKSVIRKDNQLGVNGFFPDVVLLNNDLSEGIPEILKNLNQPILPPPELGWHLRLKSEHFQHYQEICEEFAKIIGIDPWLINPLFRHCGEIDFMKREGEDCLQHYVDELFTQIKNKYQQYNIQCKPFIVIKADAGTYGIAVMTVREGEDLKGLNRKQRTKMATTKGGQPVTRVIIQEGVYTFETLGEESAVAEPVVYLWGQRVIGGFYRVHKSRGVDENLNAPGMHFEPLAFAKPCDEPLSEEQYDECQNRFYVYGVIAKLSMLAAAREMNALE